MNFRVAFSSSEESVIGMLIICTIAVSTILILLTHECGRPVCPLMSSSIYAFSGLKIIVFSHYAMFLPLTVVYLTISLLEDRSYSIFSLVQNTATVVISNSLNA